MKELQIQENLIRATQALFNNDINKCNEELVNAAQKISVLIAMSSGSEKELYQNLLHQVVKLKKDMGEYHKIYQRPTEIDNMVGEYNNSQISSSIPKVSLDDVVGLEDVKQSILYKVVYPFKYPKIYETLKKNCGGGILLYGLPGTGKTMIAKAVATEINAKFYSVKCSDLGSKWFGETERRLKELFDKARSDERSVVFFDEIEAYAGKRNEDPTMQRVVSEFLSQMSGLTASENAMLIIAATNKPWQIDTAFLRPGRFDEKIYVPLPNENARKLMIEKRLKDIPTLDDIDMSTIAKLTDGFNGADIEYLCEKAKEIAIGNILNQNRKKISLSNSDFFEALKNVQSSVSAEDISQMQGWKNIRR